MRRILLVAGVVSLLAVGVAGCGDDGPAADGAALSVVATTTVVADFARVIGGDRVAVHGVLKPNVDAHDYEPSPADLDAMARAKVIVKNGAGLEAWLDDTIESSGTKATVVDASEGVTRRHAGATGHAGTGNGTATGTGTGTGNGTAGTGTGNGTATGTGHTDGADDHDEGDDPHIWHDPRNAKVMVANVARAFAAADPAGAATYEQNLAAYTAELDELDQELATTFGALTNKKLVTNHDAFGYLVDRYGLVFVGSIIPSFDTSAELSGADLQQLVTKIKAEGVKAVFSESSLPARTAKTIADEAKVSVVAGDGALYGDGLGTAGSDGGTYLKMMRHNATTIATNLR